MHSATWLLNAVPHYGWIQLPGHFVQQLESKLLNTPAFILKYPVSSLHNNGPFLPLTKHPGNVLSLVLCRCSSPAASDRKLAEEGVGEGVGAEATIHSLRRICLTTIVT